MPEVSSTAFLKMADHESGGGSCVTSWCLSVRLPCREDLTGWRDEASYSSDDEIPHVQLSSALAAQSPAGVTVMAENALTLKPLLTSAEQAPLGDAATPAAHLGRDRQPRAALRVPGQPHRASTASQQPKLCRWKVRLLPASMYSLNSLRQIS